MRLKAAQVKARDELTRRLDEAHGALAAGVEAYDTAMRAAFDEHVEPVLAELNKVISEAANWCGEVAGDARSEYDDKSDKWQEGERGQAADTWIQEFENVDLEDIVMDQPDELETPDFNPDVLSNLPEDDGGA